MILKQTIQFQHPNHIKTWSNILPTVIIFFLALFIGIALFRINSYYSFLVLPILFACMSRFFVIMHDLGHGSLLKSKKIQNLLGNFLGFLIGIPFVFWKYIHNDHHSSFGNLDKRHKNPELWVLTTKEYEAVNKFTKFIYRIVRNPVTRLFDPVSFLLICRIPLIRYSKKVNVYILITDLLYSLLFLALFEADFLFGFLLIYMLPLYFFLLFAILVVHLQHQFENTYWAPTEKWNHMDASLKGSSFTKFPKLLKWTTANIGYHHIHHINPKIPFYNLADCHNEIMTDHEVPTLKFTHVLKHLKLTLWDTVNNKMLP